jgi:hypothetical protein
VILVVATAVVLTVAVSFILARRMRRPAITLELAADHPIPFGYKMAWLAIRTADTAAVVDALGLRQVQVCNWKSGIGAAYDEDLGEAFLFVSPPIENWTFVIGLGLPHPIGRSFIDKATPLLLELGSRFSEVQYFFSYPPVDFFAWARVVDGKLARAFAAGDEGVVWNKGRPTRAEHALGLRLFELRGVHARKGDAGGRLLLHPTEEHVMQVAAGWSLDPARIQARRSHAAVGYVGLVPIGWRPERLRRAA